MKVFDSTLSALSFLQNNPSIVAIGNYDGVHFGHQQIIKQLLQLAEKHHLTPVLLTFDPHPVKVLSPATAPQLLMTRKQKTEVLSSTGLAAVVWQHFDETLAQLSPADFISIHLKHNLNAKMVLVGYDFTFGHQRSGTTETLEALCVQNNMTAHIVAAQMLDNTLVSSSVIRKLILQSNLPLANKLLTRSYFIDGDVVKGHQRGTALGLHTANLRTNNELLPPDGVYATTMTVMHPDSNQNRIYQSVTNIGFNPTFNNTERSIETHVFDFEGDLYNQNIRVSFIEKIREEIRFANADALVQQIKKDIQHAKIILKDL